MDSTDIVADQMKEMLMAADLLSDKRTKDNEFHVSDYTKSFEDTAKVFYGNEIELQTTNIW